MMAETKKKKEKKLFTITIGWGRKGRDLGTGRKARQIETYTFTTRASLTSFLDGVSESSGWTEYTVHSGDYSGNDRMDGLWEDYR
jgi:hypothetical protein